MDGEVEGHFNEIITLGKKHLQDVKIERDVSYKRALLKIRGVFKGSEVRVTEVIDMAGRKYSYYLLREGEVVVGFDNAPDVRALRIKYGAKLKGHLGESIPHRHGEKKKTITLTNEIKFKDFLNEIITLLKSGNMDR